MNNLPWERMSGESAQAYEAAHLYFDLGADRSFEAVSQKLGKSRQLLSRWSARWQWVARSRAFDSAMHTRETAAREAAQAAEAERWAARRAEEAEREWTLAAKLIERAQAMLAFPLQTQELQTDGKTFIVNPARWALRDAATMIDTASKLARLAAEMETERATVQSPGGGPVVVREVIVKLPDATPLES